VSDAGTDALYPFLSSRERDVDAVLADVRRSTEEKAVETLALRESVVADHADALIDCADAMAVRFASGGRLLAFGNGGSSTDAQDLAQTFLAPHTGRALPALNLAADVATLTALGNDVGFDVVFARPIAAMGRPADIAVALSTSGGSPNVLRGLAEARRSGLLTVGFAGYDGGTMADEGMVDHLFVVPSTSVHRIQESQTTLYHLLWSLTQAALEHEELPT
jgi:D-sedoheptulose 7-phosphate isomerase